MGMTGLFVFELLLFAFEQEHGLGVYVNWFVIFHNKGTQWGHDFVALFFCLGELFGFLLRERVAWLFGEGEAAIGVLFDLVHKRLLKAFHIG
jgi:hypothetical protein